MKRFFVAVMLVLGLSLSTHTVRANWSLTYPDDSWMASWLLSPSGHAALFWDIPGDLDLFTQHSSIYSNAVSANLMSPTPTYALAYWFNYLYSSGGYLYFDFYARDSYGWYYAGTMVL